MSQLLLLLLLTALSLSVTVNSSASAFAPGYTASPPRPVQVPTSVSAGHNRGIRPIATQQQRKSIAAVQLNMEAGTPALVYGAAAVATFGIQTGGFAVAYLLKTEKFYDILGGVNYLLLALLSAVLGVAGDGALPWTDDPRKILATALFAVSRSWLLFFLAWRAHERQGDARFDEVLGKGASAGHPPRPAGFFAYWMVQAFWVMLVSMPMLFINASRVAKPGFSALDYVWVLLFGTGVFTEIVADIQKAHWVKRGRQGDFCETGLWKYSRKLHDTPPPPPPLSNFVRSACSYPVTGHPNYFGEIFQWWCLFAFSYASSGNSLGGYADPLWWAGIVSPLFSVQILLNLPATGICNAEGKNLKRYYDKGAERYAKSRENTSVLIPFVGYGYIPLFLKRTIFFDFEKYEYRPRSGESAENATKKKC